METGGKCTYLPGRGGVGRVTDCGVRGSNIEQKLLTSRTETSCLSRVVRYGEDTCSVPLSGRIKSPTVESSA